MNDLVPFAFSNAMRRPTWTADYRKTRQSTLWKIRRHCFRMSSPPKAGSAEHRPKMEIPSRRLNRGKRRIARRRTDSTNNCALRIEPKLVKRPAMSSQKRSNRSDHVAPTDEGPTYQAIPLRAFPTRLHWLNRSTWRHSLVLMAAFSFLACRWGRPRNCILRDLKHETDHIGPQNWRHQSLTVTPCAIEWEFQLIHKEKLVFMLKIVFLGAPRDMHAWNQRWLSTLSASPDSKLLTLKTIHSPIDTIVQRLLSDSMRIETSRVQPRRIRC